MLGDLLLCLLIAALAVLCLNGIILLVLAFQVLFLILKLINITIFSASDCLVFHQSSRIVRRAFRSMVLQ